MQEGLSGEMHPSVQYSFREKEPVGILAEALKAYKPKFTHGMSTVERQKAKDVAAERVADILSPRSGHVKPKRE